MLHRNARWYVSPWNYYPEVTGDFEFAENILIHDVTLRDGEQETGVVFTAQDKIEIAKKLAALGVHRIEAGMPAVSAEDEYAVKSIVDMNLGPRIFSFARCMVSDVQMAAQAGCDGIVMEIAANQEFVEKAYGKTFDWAKKAAIDATIAAKELGLYTAFFTIDGTRAEIDALLDMVDEVATNGHMDSFVIADTFGCATPEAARAMMRRIKARFKQPVEAHFHMNFGLGVPNTIAALAAGADVAHVTVCGIGEGAGNTPIEDVVMSLKCLYNKDVGIRTEKMVETAEFVCDIANGHAIPVNRPFLGERVFKMESGAGVMFAVNAAKAGDFGIMYSYNPALVGQPPMDFVLGKKSGTYTTNLWLERMSRTATDDQSMDILARVKELALGKRELLTETEFARIVEDVLGPYEEKPVFNKSFTDRAAVAACKACEEEETAVRG
ncbi:MAG: pyruvate carboxyltransferase [Armatimonadetes bacterium]|nr:pyruvate carboxyltransferase [Armatimonadota bacterium]